MSKVFGKRLREIRKEKHYTQQAIADIFCVSKMTISSWETDKQEPDIDDIRRLCFLFKVSADYLLGLEDESGRKIYNTVSNHIADNHGTINQTNNFN